MLAMLLAVQAVAGPPAPREVRRPLAQASVPCPVTAPGDEIVVCGRPTDQRMPPLPAPARRAPDSAMTFRLPGGGTGNVHAIKSRLPSAAGSGAAVTLRMPFGGVKTR